MSMNPMENFDGPSQQIMALSYRILMQAKQSQLEVEHLLMALLMQQNSFAEYVLEQLKVDRGLVMLAIEEKLAALPQNLKSNPGGVSVSLYITPRLQEVLTKANNERLAHHSDLVTPRDLMLAVVVDPNDPAAILLKRFGVDFEKLANVRPDNLEKSPPANGQVTVPDPPAEPVEATPLTHFNEEGRARMVDVSEKEITGRRAVARGEIHMQPETLALIREGRAKKGDVLAVAQVAGIMAAKKTSEIVPMCHPLMLTGIDLHFEYAQEGSAVLIEAEVKTSGQTGVEMEALTAVSAAALTIYDMVKATDKGMRIENVRLVHKSGGKSGDYEAE